ncbi:MAG: hypothetical protein CSA22_05135 [Deltaproteobacteria bacterium]|nr:MAG: hypothetical protein CSA22_05135 [Deltaproteobacteria bacterium]
MNTYHPLVSRFLRLNIATKMSLGYLPLAGIILLIAIFALVGLGKMNQINNTIVHHDIIVIETVDKLIDNLLAQESYARRYLIIGNADMYQMHLKRAAEFDTLVNRLRSLPDQSALPIHEIQSMYTNLNNTYQNAFKQVKESDIPVPVIDDTLSRTLKKLITLLQTTADSVHHSLNRKMIHSSDLGIYTFRIMASLSFLGLLVGIASALLITRNIARSIHQLKIATDEIASGRFDYEIRVHDQGELGELATAFQTMAHRLGRLEEMYLDASPLTRLPGGVAIENILKKRLDAKETVAFCMVDLDNFKSFNDRYGYAKGNQMIKMTAAIIESAVQAFGSPTDFIGHIGGDDFAVITEPKNARQICEQIVRVFDEKVISHYEACDLEKGYIESTARSGERSEFPIMSVSIAIASNESRQDVNHIQLGEVAAELKRLAKSLPGSQYVTDRRRYDKTEDRYADTNDTLQSEKETLTG